MAKRAAPHEFKRGEIVRALEPLPGVPAGERGRVYLVDGFTWTRYRVLFDNGVDIGSIDGSKLARPRDYEAALARRAEAAAAEVEDAHAVAIDVVAVGDHRLDDPGRALVAAMREALTNAA